MTRTVDRLAVGGGRGWSGTSRPATTRRRSTSIGSAFTLSLARHNRSAPVAAACCHKANPENPRSASTPSPARAGRPVRRPASSPTSCTRRSRRRTWRGCRTRPTPPPGPAGTPHVHPCSPPDARRTRRSPACRRHRDRSRRSPPAAAPPASTPACPDPPTDERPDRTTPPPARTPTGPEPGRSPTSTATSPAPRRARDHANPSVNNASTSSYEPSECNAIPIAKYAIVRAGNDRCRCSVRPDSAITSSTTSGGNTLVSNPTDTRSDNRRSDSGFIQPARGTHPNYTDVTLTERYCA